VPFDLSNIRKAANREAEESPPQRTRNGLADTRLANTGWANEADDLALYGPAQFADSEEFKDARFDIREAVVVRVEDALCVREREVFGRMCSPGDLFSQIEKLHI